MTRNLCLSTIANAALLLAIAGYGCGGASDALPEPGTGGGTVSGSGGSSGSSGGSTGSGSGGSFGGGSGGSFGGGSGGAPGTRPDGGGMRPDGGGMRPDGGGMRPDGGGMRPDGGGTRDARPMRDAGGGGNDGGTIAMCVPGAPCRSATPEPTCMDMCPGGGERACACTALGVVRCAACPRADGGAADTGGGGRDAGGGGMACPAGAATGMTCTTACTVTCPAGGRMGCVCRGGMYTCFGMCM